MTYTPEIGDEICEITATSNKSLGTIAEELGLAYRTVRRWIKEIQPFREAYEKAKSDQADFLAEELISIADTPASDVPEAMTRKLQVDARKWVAAKLKPKTYGDKQHVDIDVKQSLQVTGEQFAALLTEARQASLKQDAEDAEYEDITQARIEAPADEALKSEELDAEPSNNGDAEPDYM